MIAGKRLTQICKRSPQPDINFNQSIQQAEINCTISVVPKANFSFSNLISIEEIMIFFQSVLAMIVFLYISLSNFISK